MLMSTVINVCGRMMVLSHGNDTDQVQLRRRVLFVCLSWKEQLAVVTCPP
jgi:hypothetical protein